MIILRSLVSIAILPGVALVLLPWLIVRGTPITTFAWIGALPLAVGLALSIWCVIEFARRGRGTPAPWDAPRRFVASGPYRFVRNPMYLAGASVVLGEAVAFGSLPLVIYLVALVTVWHAFVVLYEEPTLSRQFGADYAAYRTRVHRWVPRIP
jgi:protein-S-isoprenylcysteine O-methyltransferase Ste14